MITALHMKNHLDAQSQLRRFDPEALLIAHVDGIMRPVVLLNSVIDKETGRAVIVMELGEEVKP